MHRQMPFWRAKRNECLMEDRKKISHKEKWTKTEFNAINVNFTKKFETVSSAFRYSAHPIFYPYDETICVPVRSAFLFFMPFLITKCTIAPM